MNTFEAYLQTTREIAPGLFRQTFSAPESFSPAPGQFVHLRVQALARFILRRPISVLDAAPGHFDILFKVRGAGTRALAGLQPGQAVNTIGPLGHGFSVPASGPLWLISGGVGLAPIYRLARSLHPADRARTRILCGSAGNEYHTLHAELEAADFSIEVATDDGSAGIRGTVSNLLDLSPAPAPDTTLLTCGPEPMLKTVARYARARSLACQVSLENFMGCGVGACLCCVVENHGGRYARVCTDGPVFDLNAIDPEARWTQI